MTGEEVARQLVTAISTELGIASDDVVAVMHDRASVNSVAMRTIIIDVGCFSHTLDLVGKHMNTPVLDKFAKSWISLFSHSPKSRLQWRTQTGLSIPSYSATRWWSKFEVLHQVFKAFGDVQSFLQSSELPPATSEKLLAIINDAAKFRKANRTSCNRRCNGRIC